MINTCILNKKRLYIQLIIDIYPMKLVFDYDNDKLLQFIAIVFKRMTKNIKFIDFLFI